MEDEIILNQTADRRVAGDGNDLPAGPPGAEIDDIYPDNKKDERSVAKESSKSRRRSPSGSPPPSKRKSPSRGPRSPRGRRTPSPRRRFGRNRDYSPDRRRFNDRGRMRRSPLRNRSRDRMDHRRNGRDRFRGRRDSRSRSNSPQSRRRWSPKKKPSSPPIPPPGAQYGVPGPAMYADAYAAYGQYGPPQQAYGPADFVAAAPQAAFGAAYPPPPAWGVTAEGYPQANWVPQPEPLPPVMMQPQAVANAQQPVVVQPPGTQPPPPTIAGPEKIDVNPTHDAVAQEAENQRDELKKQRTSYLKKAATLKKELKALKDQRKDLIGGDGSHSPTTKGFLDENERLQSQIQKKLSTIENVIDMLTGIIGAENLAKDETVESPKKHSKKKRSNSSSSSSDDSSSSTSSSSSSSTSSSDSEDNSSPERLKNKAIESMKHKRDVQGKLKEKKLKDEVKKTEDKKINYVFYDPEMHWCKTCDTFPKTAKDYLTHLHSKEHSDHVDTMETPWHVSMTTDEYPSYESAPTKRTPIRGLTFFVPATAWYCKLCSVWMGDLHCASLHLKSRTHSNKYNTFLEKNPHFEVDWLADRQRVLNTKKSAPPPPQITSVSTTGVSDQKESKPKSKHEDKEKSSKKRKKKSSDKKDKKKKKRSKKRKKAAVSDSSSSSNDSSSETEAKAEKKKLIDAIPVPSEAPGLAAPSIRVQMRNLKKGKEVESEEPAPPPPPKISEQPIQPAVVSPNENNKKDDLISQWNIVQPVISDSEKKLFEQLKGKLKNKPTPKEEEEKKKEEKIVVQPPVVAFIKANTKKGSTEIRERVRSPSKREDDRVDKDRSNGRGGSVYRRRSRSRPTRRSKSRSPSRGRRGRRSRSRGGMARRSRSRGRRSPSRGRYSPRGFGRRRRSRSQRRRSRSYGRMRRRGSSSRSRSRSRSGSHRIEKPIIRQPEFRPRVPENINAKKSKSKDEKEDRKKSSKSSSSASEKSSKKLPFIGRMPVFKKQSQNCENSEEKKEEQDEIQSAEMNPMTVGPMPMVQDAYAHAGYEPSMMCEYDDLMPDPVQFVSLMGAPPPPPPQQYAEEEKDILPPGIDETESEFVPKPISDAPIPRKGPLPKDFEEALNIIFPGDKKPDDESSTAKSTGETQIITEQPVMQQSDLIKEGIHMMTVEETSLVGMDEASQMSMNEPLQFNKPSSAVATPSANNSGENSIDKSPPSLDPVEEAVAACVSAIPPPPPPPAEEKENQQIIESVQENKVKSLAQEVESLPICKELEINDIDPKHGAVEQPPSPTESEKNRRQEELDDLAMLGIDADDMAAQCI